MTNSTHQSKPVKTVEPQAQAENHHGQSAPLSAMLPGSVMAGHIQHDPRGLNANSLLQLQRSIGNRAVGSMLGVNRVTPAPQQNGVIQRKFEGDLEGKNSEDVIELLKSSGYKIFPYMKVKLERLRMSPAPQDSVSSLNDVVRELGLTPIQSSKDTGTQPTTSKPNFTVKKREPTPEKMPEPEDKKPGSVQYNFTVKKKERSRVHDPSSLPSNLGIGGGTTWTQASTYADITGTAKEEAPPQEFGQLKLSYSFTPKGLHFDLDIFSNPKLMWDQGDKVSISLQFKSRGEHHLGDLRVQKAGNTVKLLGTIEFADLGDLLEVKGLKGSVEDKRARLAEVCSQMGMLAMWRTKDDVGEQHRSGGIDQKGGSGLINVSATPISEKTLKQTELLGIRNVGWNESELATMDRPLVKNFPNLIKLEHEIATTLEAESEYLVNKEGYENILSAMGKFTGSGGKALLEEFGIQKEVKPSVKHYVDTYYDLDLSSEGKEDKSLPLLHRNIVFRKRSVPKDLNNGEGDPEDTNLIAIKGRSVTNESEAIRLAAQFQAQYDLLNKEKQSEVMEFLRSEQVDNPFARVLQDALGKESTGLLSKARGIKKALTVNSKRTKYKLWLVNSTMIDLSVDEAKGEMDGYEKRDDDIVYSFEFGVGHPGLSAGATAGSGLSEEDPTLMKLENELRQIPKESIGPKTVKSDTIKRRQERTNKLVHRPYHVPDDLEYGRLFEKDDYKQYMGLRDALINRLFGMEKSRLTRGGNKAKLLAQKIKAVEDL